MDSVPERINALKKMPLLAALPHEDLEKIATQLRLESYEAGVDIIRQGSNGSSAYFVLSGKCEVVRGDKRICFLSPGEFFGELAVIHPAPRTTTVLAHEATILMVLTAAEFKMALSHSHAMALQLVEVLARRLQAREDEFA